MKHKKESTTPSIRSTHTAQFKEQALGWRFSTGMNGWFRAEYASNSR